VSARRFSAVALWCFIAMAVSGIINAGVRIRLSDLFSTSYGWLVVAKAVALLTLGVIGGCTGLRFAFPAARGEPRRAGDSRR
jgi:putative copper resistance protein D